MPGEFALSLVIKSLHLRHQSLERFCDFLLAVVAEAHFNRRRIRSEVERLLKFFRQIAERDVLINLKVFHKRLLQMPIVRLHTLCPTAPWRNRPFSQRSRRIRDHQVWIADELCAKPVTCRASTEMAVKRKMFGAQIAERESRLGIAILGRIAAFFPMLFGISS